MTDPVTPRRQRPWRIAGVMALVAVVAVALVAVLTPDDSAGPGNATVRTEGTGPVRIGYVPYWDQRRALDVVWQHPDMFDEVSPVWYSLEPNGRVVLADDKYTHVNPQAVQAMQERGIRVIPTVKSLRNDYWKADIVKQMLQY